jgi:hypothetical protein
MEVGHVCYLPLPQWPLRLQITDLCNAKIDLDIPSLGAHGLLDDNAYEPGSEGEWIYGLGGFS